jgi:hypothetical protein
MGYLFKLKVLVPLAIVGVGAFLAGKKAAEG